VQLQTKSFGMLAYDEKAIIRIPEGMLGFSRLRDYVLIENPDTAPFKILQSVDDPYVAFPMIDPRLVASDYRCSVSPEDIAVLGITDLSDIILLAVTVIPDNLAESTVNLRAPLLINQRNSRGKQIVLLESVYDTMQALAPTPDQFEDTV
jgi:flagellar assembly factor FliW